MKAAGSPEADQPKRWLKFSELGSNERAGPRQGRGRLAGQRIRVSRVERSSEAKRKVGDRAAASGSRSQAGRRAPRWRSWRSRNEVPSAAGKADRAKAKGDASGGWREASNDRRGAASEQRAGRSKAEPAKTSGILEVGCGGETGPGGRSGAKARRAQAVVVSGYSRRRDRNLARARRREPAGGG